MPLMALALTSFVDSGRSDAGMTDSLRAFLNAQMDAVDADVRQAIELADGDVYRALRLTLIANAFLLEENEQLKKNSSRGFARKHGR